MSVDRRGFLRTGLIGTTGAVALAGCRGKERAIHKVISQWDTPAEITPGQGVRYASVCDGCEAACGIHVRVVAGRAKKVEGAPDDPRSQGGLCARGQALVQALYHPDRGGGATLGGQPLSWEAAQAALMGRLEAAAAKGPGRVAIVGRSFPGALGAAAEALMERFGGPPPIAWRPLDTPGPPPPGPNDLEKLGAIVNLGAPLLAAGNHPVGWTKALAALRARPGRRGLLVHVAPRMGLTGAAADAWIPARAGTEALVGAALGGRAPAEEAETLAGLPPGTLAPWVVRLRAAGRVLTVGGPTPAVGGAGYEALRHLAGHIARGGVDVLIAVGPDPFERAPHLFPTAGRRAAFRVAAVERDADGRGANLVLRVHTGLEDWGSRAGPGGVTFQQPVVSPRHDTRGTGDLLLAAAGGGSMRDFVEAHHAGDLRRANLHFEGALGSGGPHGGRRPDEGSAPLGPPLAGPAAAGDGLTLLPYEAATTGDGRLAHTPWLREAREPISGGLGDTWAELSPRAATRAGVVDGGRVRLTTAQGSLTLRARVHPGQRDDVVAVPVGQDPGGPTDPLRILLPGGPTTVAAEGIA